ncbi:hypothetical protein SEA_PAULODIABOLI_322 [Microbacterium phage PauloDiaboli]|nr:hypothetical protein SEA_PAULODIABOLI_322 [Microbacterium phage PauloDiaboli]
MKTPEELQAEYEALIGSASAAIEAAEPFKTVTWKEGAPVVKTPGLLERLTFWRR